jgi:hypothetical protein
MPIRVKSVSGTRTMAVVRGTGVHSKDRHVKAFQIAALELERTRKTRELQAAHARIGTLVGRLSEIDALIARHNAALGVAAIVPDEERPIPSRKRQTVRYG